MRNKLIFLCIYVFIGIYTNANNDQKNNLDSLKSLLANETDHSVLANSYKEIAKLSQDSNPDSSLNYFQQYLHESLISNDSLLIVDAYYEMAEFYFEKEFDSCLFYTKKILEAAFVTQDTSWIANAYNFMAYAYNDKGEILASLKNWQKALDYFEKKKDTVQMIACNINIGYVISFSKDQADGLRYFLKGLKLAESINDTSLMSDANYNIADCYYWIKDYKNAIKYYESSLSLSLISNPSDTFNHALIYSNLAFLHLKLNHITEFNSFLEISKSLVPKTETPYHKAEIYSLYVESYIEQKNLDSAQFYMRLIDIILFENSFELLEGHILHQKGRIAFLKKNYNESIRYLHKSIEILLKKNSIESFALIYSHLAEANAALHQYEQAYAWQLKANSFEDSLTLGNMEGLLNEFEQSRIHEDELRHSRLEMELEQQKINNSNLQIRSKLRITFGALILISVLIIITLFFYRAIRLNNRLLYQKKGLIESQKKVLEQQVVKLENNEKMLQELNATKDKFFSIIAHDLRNPLQSIISLSELFINDADLMESKDMVKIMASMNKTANYGFSLLENLLEWSRSQTGKIITKPENFPLDKTIGNLILNFKVMAENKQIDIKFNCDILPPVYADKNMIKTVVRNLLHNAIKFSYENTTITVCIRKKDNNIITNITDQGIGISQKNLSQLFRIESQVRKLGTHKENGSGLGLILCKEFIEKNNGIITAECQKDKGCTFSFTLPIYNEKIIAN